MTKTRTKRIAIITALVLMASAFFAILSIPTAALSPKLALNDSEKGIYTGYYSDFNGYEGGPFEGHARQYNWNVQNGQDFSEGKFMSRTKGTAPAWENSADINTYARYSRDITDKSYKTDYTNVSTVPCLTDFWIQNSTMSEILPSYDYVVMDLDICADQWVLTDGSLSETYEDGARLGYFPNTSFSVCFRYNGLSSFAGNSATTYIRYDSALNQFYIQARDTSSKKYYLPNETDVWTHLTWIVEVDNSDCAPAEGATTTTLGSLIKTKLHIYVDGEYLYTYSNPITISASTSLNVMMDSYGNYQPKICVETLRLNWSSNLNTTSASFGVDNWAVNSYVAGYTGNLARHPLDAATNRAIYTCNDIVYSRNYIYSSGNKPLATVTNDGKKVPYFHSYSALSAIKSGSVVELFEDFTTEYTVTAPITLKTNGHSFNFKTGTDILYDYDEETGIYYFRDYYKVFWHLGDEIITEGYKKGATPSFKQSYPETVEIDGVVYKTVGGFTTEQLGDVDATFSKVTADVHYYAKLSDSVYFTVTSSSGAVTEILTNDFASIVENAKHGDKITFVSDITISSGVTLPSGKILYVDLAGRSLTYAANSASTYDDAVFKASNGSRFYLYSSVPGAAIYSSYYAASSIHGQPVIKCDNGVTSSKIYVGTVTKNSETHDGDNLSVYCAALIYHRGDTSNTAKITGGKYHRVINDNKALIVSDNGASVTLSNATLASNAGALISSDKAQNSSSKMNLSLTHCTIYSTGNLFNEISTGANVSIEESFIHANVNVGSSSGTVSIGNSTFLSPSTTINNNVSYIGEMVKSRSDVSFTLRLIDFSYSVTGSTASYNKEASTKVRNEGFSYNCERVIATRENFEEILWIYGTTAVAEKWYKGILPASPITVPTATDVYKFVTDTDVTVAVGGGEKTYTYIQKIAFPIYANIALNTGFIYNVYVPTSYAGYISAYRVDGADASIAGEVTIDGESYKVIKVPIIAAQGAISHEVGFTVTGYESKSFNDSYIISIPEYADKILSSDYDEKTINLMNATLAYVKAAGTHFGYDTSTIESVTNAPAYAGVAPSQVPSSVKSLFSGVQFALSGQIALRLNVREGISEGTANLVYLRNGIMVHETITENDWSSDEKGYYYELPIRALDLLEGVKITVGGESFTYSFDNYVYSISKTSLGKSDEPLMTLLYNMRAYAEAAKVFTGEPPMVKLSIAGNDISLYKIVANNASEMAAAKALRDEIYTKTKYMLAIVDSADSYAIRFNLVDCYSTDNFAISVSGTDLIINCAFSTFFVDATKAFADSFIKTIDGSYDFASSFTLTYVAESVNYDDFGAMGDGVTNDFFIMKKTHDYANQYNKKVAATPGKTYLIDRTVTAGSKSAQYIIIKTDTVWTDATIVIDDRAIYNGSGTNEYNVNIFVVKPFESDYNLSAAQIANINTESITRDTKKLNVTFDSDVLIRIINNTHKTYIRYGSNANAGKDQSECLYVYPDGTISDTTPIMHDFSTITSVIVTRANLPELTIEGGTVITRASNVSTTVDGVDKMVYFARGLSIQRSNTTVRNLDHQVTDELEFIEGVQTGPAYSGFFGGGFASHITIDSCILSARKYYKIAGTYDFGASFSNEISLVNCTMHKFYLENGKISTAGNAYWGVGGTNYCKNMSYINCELTRYDAHSGVYNGKIIGGKIGIINLIGAGDMLIEDVTIVQSNRVFHLRSDYGSTWNGTITVRNVTMDNTGGVVICAAGWNNHYFGYDCYFPDIVVENINLKLKATVEIVNGGNTSPQYSYSHLPTLPSESFEDTTNVNVFIPPKRFEVIDDYGYNFIFPSSTSAFFENTQKIYNGKEYN